MIKYHTYIYIILLLGFFARTSAQKIEMPSVFLTGEYENAYEQLGSECQDILMTVCEDSMERAYTNWISMLSEIQLYAEKKEYDINGIKIWINTYWNPDGTIKHIVYYPKPNSRNTDFDALTMFLREFVKEHRLPLTHTSCFSHYGSASFPVYRKVYPKEEK